MHKLCMVLLSGLALVGCKSDNYVGKVIPRQNRIAIRQGGPHQGTWFGSHMAFQYRYVKTPSQIEFTGGLSLVDIPVALEPTRIGLWVHFLDAEGRIIRDRTVHSANASWNGGKYIQKVLNPPAGTKGMAFSYQIGIEGDSDVNFHLEPHQAH